ncbi:hypothetical protein [Emticicia sp. W12TSBA100-4]|uniref:hypothetical protein n=1 Tax=Emticicia sp. W12TSBA100-4 TaxID=3160965 RepID=UPI00330597AB
MTYYDLPLLFTNRQLVYVRLLPEPDATTQPLATTIIPKEIGKVYLFSTLSNKIIGSTLSDDKVFIISSVARNGNDLSIELQVASEDDASTPSFNNVKAKLNKENTFGECNFSLDYSDTQTIESITFSVEINDINYIGIKKICFAPKKQIFDIAIDFGSEASQMTIRNLEDERLRRFPIADSLKSFFYNNLSGDFHQKEDNELYRSLFFIKLEEAILDLENQPGLEANELIPLLTEVIQIDTLIETHQLVSTLKLANTGAFNFDIRFKNHYNGIQGHNFDAIVSDVQQVIINGFLHAAINEIKRTSPLESPFHIRLKLLVPNVLAQEKISNLVKKTNAFLEKMSVKEGSLKTFHTATISESDASFLGYWSEIGEHIRRENREPNKRFIIIDMGKGTTDFSIIHSNENFELTSEFRSGFIGAGNVITYSFIETIFTHIFGKNEKQKQKALKHFLLKKPDAFQLRFLSLIEQLKANFSSVKNTKNIGEMSFSDSIKGIINTNDLGAVTDSQIELFIQEIIVNQPSIKDEFGYIAKAIEGLIEKLKQTLLIYTHNKKSENVKGAKIILTGRSFLFNPLYFATKEAFAGIECIKLDNVNDKTRLKKVCLEGAYGEVNLNYDSNLSGFPNLVDKDFVDKMSDTHTFNKTQKEARWNNWKVINMLSNIFLDQNENDEPISEDIYMKKEHDTTKAEFTKIEDKTIAMSLGLYELSKPFNQNKDTLYVSGVNYTLNLQTQVNFRLYFDGDALFARTTKERVRLAVPVRFAQNTPYMFETLFPFNSHVQEHEIVVQPDVNAIPIL